MITPTDIIIMSTLYKYMDINKIYEKDFKKRIKKETSTINRSLKNMQEKGWIQILREGRTCSIWLTEKGRRIAQNSYELLELTRSDQD